ncbi:hypothetical protein [Clostridium sp.]|uniref:hypothetical protein n=1 Tax=Clostridium sp. TaxID=1506 RepID=UPI00283DC994|nr:hypothetical protein [Clostridium sp.]MDR3598257.1 hypothetical protein [Clostridium sp.]
MKKLILLNEVRAEKIKYKNKLSISNVNDREEKDSENSYITFKEKFNWLQNKEELVDLNKGNNVKSKRNSFEKNLNRILEKIFLLNNNIPLIDFINSIYNDDLSKKTKIKYIKNKKNTSNNEIIFLNESNYNIKILAEDEYKKFEYIMQFQIKDEQNIGIIISKKQLSNNPNIISFNMRRRKYVNENNSKDDCEKCLIILDSNVEVPDVYEFITDCEGKDVACKVNIIKSWKYDFKQLLENKMYLLAPTKVIDFIKIISKMSNDSLSKEEIKQLIKNDIIRFYKDMNRYLNKIKAENLITDNDINELNILAVDLLNEFIRDKNNILIDIKRDVVATLKDIVV